MSPATAPTSDAVDVAIRPARWTDLADLARAETDLFPDDAWSEATWWSELAARPRRDYLVAVDADGLVGYAGLDVSGDTADLMTIAVIPRGRGTGVGRRLLAAVEDRAIERGAEAMLLEVRADNDRAIDLYDRSGYAHLSTRRKYYQPGDVDALVMRKLLPPKGSHHG